MHALPTISCSNTKHNIYRACPSTESVLKLTPVDHAGLVLNSQTSTCLSGAVLKVCATTAQPDLAFYIQCHANANINMVATDSKFI